MCCSVCMYSTRDTASSCCKLSHHSQHTSLTVQHQVTLLRCSVEADHCQHYPINGCMNQEFGHLRMFYVCSRWPWTMPRDKLLVY